ncbi:MAG: 50S ribosomal protein L11 methyltransferase [bacterium]|nr:50S ribosomal protein L11 methyltransferase [bacterium]
MRLEIVDVGYGGDGVARTPDGVVFVPGAFKGEIVDAEIRSRKKSFARARLREVLTPSPDRIPPEGLVVPGMVYAGLNYPAEVALKTEQLKTLLQRIGKFETIEDFLLPSVPSPIRNHYRNKLTLHWDGRKLGYVSDDHRTLMDTPACPLSVPSINDTLMRLRGDHSKLKKLKAGGRVTFRFSPFEGVMIGIGDPPKGRLTETLSGLTLHVAADAFFQVNIACTERLLDTFKECLGPVQKVFDLYCGCGLFGLAAAQAGASYIFGIETSQSAVKSAQNNAREMGIKANYQCAPSEALPTDLPAADLWIVDPPRDGLSEIVRTHILNALPPRIAYISCGPDTLARDLRSLNEKYQIESMQLFDFFPQTAHFETLTFLSRL